MLRFGLDMETCVTLLMCVYEASSGCAGVQCAARTNGSATTGAGCCETKQRTLAEHVVWLARKLSGLLILLALFAVGYFVQRLVCPRHRRRGRAPQEPDSLLSAHTTASRDTLLERSEYEERGVEGFASPVLQPPAYDEIKDLPTYEESVRAADLQNPGGSVRPAGASRDKPEASRIFRNSV